MDLRRVLDRAMLALLRRMEWGGEVAQYDNMGRLAVCPVCNQRKSWGHDGACEIQAAIYALEMLINSPEVQ